MLFSQRMGFKPIRSIIQVESLDEELRNGLWDALQVHVWGNWSNSFQDLNDTPLSEYFKFVWHLYFRKPIDTLPRRVREAIADVRGYFFSCAWNEVYDFIEFSLGYAQESRALAKFVNMVLERELSGYRVVDNQLIPISSKEEVASIEAAIRSTDRLASANNHLKRAVSLLADRKNPDHRNSIKEAISAVESICQVISGDSKATLGTALKALEQRSLMHPALKASLSSLYGYTSDAEGIRHAMLEEPTLTAVDSKFMLVACTAFINYLVGKAAEGSIKLG